MERDGSIIPTIETTDDGSQTLRHPLFCDTYHSVRGAGGEARHVYIEAGFRWVARLGSEQRSGAESRSSVEAPSDSERRSDAEARLSSELRSDSETLSGQPIRIFEMGFGSGLNAWLTAREAAAAGLEVEYCAIEHYPVAPEVALRLGYASDPLFAAMHEAAWNVPVTVAPGFSLKKVAGSLLDYRFDTTFDLVYFDAFAPDTQPELWSREVFAALYGALTPGGVLVTYSAKGTVKENLRAAGFDVKRLPGALGKRHMLRAVKPAAGVGEGQ